MKYIITLADLLANPDLAKELAIGDEIEIPEDTMIMVPDFLSHLPKKWDNENKNDAEFDNK